MADETRTWRLVWSDDFDGELGSAPDLHRWTYDIGHKWNGWGNNELQYYTNSTKNAFMDGEGHLVIRAIKDDPDFPDEPYTSARLLSHNAGNWTYGRIEVRAELPKGGIGIWPAIWMLPTNSVYSGWPVSGEIDIMEMIGQEPLKVHGTIHFGEPKGQVGAFHVLPDAGFHTYALEWSPNSLEWFVDDRSYQLVHSKEWYSSEGPSPAPFDQPFHLLLNLAVGGNWPGYPDSTVTFPQEMTVDYVRVYQREEQD